MILGIESTAHTFGIGIVDKGKVLCNLREMYTTESGGIIPMESAKHHFECSENVFKQALAEAKITEVEIDAIAFSAAPGLAPCLIEGMKFAKKKAKELVVPLISVNHCVAHLEIGGITGAKDPVLLYASGANTQIIANFARHLGMGFPGGPKVQELAEGADEKNYIELPYKLKGMDVAFSGILTKLKQMKESGEYKDKDLCFSLQETVFAMLVEAAERALAHTGKKELLLGGGVGCNSRLQEMCKIMCKERGCKFFVPERPLLVDNGAMIGYLGEIMFEKGLGVEGKEIEKIDINPKERTDMVNVNWR